MLWRLLCAAVLCMAAPALARSSIGPACHAAAAVNEDYAVVAARPARWLCAPRDWPMVAERSFLRFDLKPGDSQPTAFATRLTRFATMRLTVMGTGGRVAHRDITEADMVPATSGWQMAAALPRIDGPAERVIVRMDGARDVGLLSRARLVADAGDTPASLRQELLMAMLCGVFLLPLTFSFPLFRILRERFLPWHAGSIAMLLAHVLVTSGIINRFLTLTLTQLAVTSVLTLAGGFAFGALCSADLIEAEKLEPLHRRLLRGAAVWMTAWTAFYLAAGGSLRPLAPPLYAAASMSMMALFAWVTITARRRGSRAAGFQIAAWLPLMLICIVSTGSTLISETPIELRMETFWAIGLQILIASLGAMDRLETLRRQRDLAMAEMRVFERRAERDVLTGLLNRGAVEPRFAELHEQGFRTMAVIDLDRFKAINDTHGHVVGDAVLRAAAEALEPDTDTLVVRMGGEEFLLLLRGTEPVARAERRRQAIPARFSNTIPSLDRLVTASMGLVEQPAGGAVRADFPTLYAHCDRLLYEAKHAGRNRTMRERMQSFVSPAASHVA